MQAFAIMHSDLSEVAFKQDFQLILSMLLSQKMDSGG